MSRLFARLGSAFVAPPVRERPVAAPRESARAGRREGPLQVAVLCRPGDAAVAAGAVALLLAGRTRSPGALVAAWGAAVPVRAPASGAARRLASTLAGRGHAASATGRLAVVELAGELPAAVGEASRAAAVAGDIPTIAVLAGPRDATGDALLRAQDAVLVAVPPDGDAAVADLALDGLAPLAVPAAALHLSSASASVRGLAAAGVAALPPLRGSVEAALEEAR
jgi:hypothetical protein